MHRPPPGPAAASGPGQPRCSRAPSLRGPAQRIGRTRRRPRGGGRRARTGPGCPLAALPPVSTPAEREGDPRGGAADHASAARTPAPGFPTSGCSSPGGEVANLRDPTPPRGSAVSKTLPCTQAGPPGRVRPEPATAELTAAPRAGNSSVPHAPGARRARSWAVSHRTAAVPRPRGRGAPLAGRGDERALARAGPERGRFLRDVLALSQAPAGVGRRHQPAAADGDNRYPHLPSPLPSPRAKPPPTQSGPNLKVSWSLTRRRGHRAAASQGLALCLRERRWQLFAWVAKCKKSSNINCLSLQTHHVSLQFEMGLAAAHFSSS